MTDQTRMLDKARQPTPAEVARWVGARSFGRWRELTDFVDAQYPGVFEPDWYFGGRKWGWALRYKKSKSFCTFLPERGRFQVLLVFGADERQKVEPILKDLVSHVREDYVRATTFHDGKWMATTVDSARVIADLERLLTLKRPPKKAAATKPRGASRGRGRA
jgi:hypothetical protein